MELVSEIAVQRCVINPDVGGDFCYPDSTSEEDAIKGKWVRVPRNLNLEGGYMSGWLVCNYSHASPWVYGLTYAQNIYYRRTRRQDINLVTDVQLFSDQEKPSSLEGWHKTSTSVRAGLRAIPPLHLWYKIGKAAGDMTAEEKANIITELDVLYGEDVPWYGFEKLEPATLPKHKKLEATWITYRRGVKSVWFRPSDGIV